AEMAEMPRELGKTSHAPYRVEPPDILQIDAVNNIKLSDAPLQAGDQVMIRLQVGLPIVPLKDPELEPIEYQYELEREIELKIINGLYLVGADGAIDLGPAY